MALSKTDALTKQFYDWEIRGRGMLLATVPVELEPPFHPFFEHHVPEAYIDDGKKHTWLSSLFKSQEPWRYQYQPPEYAVYPFETSEALVAYEIVFSKQGKIRLESIEQLYVLCSYCSYPLSFELIATGYTVHSQLVCRTSDKGYVFSQLKAFFPDASIHERVEFLDGIVMDEKPIHLTDFGLGQEFMRPLHSGGGLDPDPYTSLFGIFEQLRQEERVVLQILFQSTKNEWNKSIVASVSDGYKGSFFLDAPEMPQLANEKISRPLYGVCVRMLAQAANESDALRLLQTTSAIFCTSTASKHNALTPVANKDYSFDMRLSDVLYRESHRVGMLLNSKELATIAHFPNPNIFSSKLVRTVKRTKVVPTSYTDHSYTLGINMHQGIETAVSISSEQRLRHLHVIGATGTRKSSLLLHLINQDIQNGEGVCVLDPHGDLIENILPYIPKERIQDVVLIDPSDREYPVGFNILSAQTETEKEVLSSDLVALFKRFSTSWGDQMNSVFANAIIACLDNTKVWTLVDLKRFLIEREFREQVLATVTDPDITYYWRKEFPLLKGGSIAPILTRLDTFLRPKLIRNMVSQQQSLNFQDLMDGKKIVLVKLSEGMIGQENSFLLGAFIVSKIQQAAMARQAISQSTRTPFYLYIDEFQHFITPSMANMLSGVRKYGVGLVLAHQDMAQVSKYDTELASSILANAGTRICFRVGDTDAKRLADGFSYFTTEDLQNLSAGEAIVRVNRNEDDFSMLANSLRPTEECGHAEAIIAHSRSQYSTVIPITATPPESTVEPVAIPLPIAEPIRHEEKIKPFPQLQSEHRYYQVLFKKMAEANGYKATMEAPIPHTKERVDVLLEKDAVTIAVEISKSTDASWELHNIEKCINAGYSKIFACVIETNTRNALQKLLDTLNPVPTNVQIDTPESLLSLLQGQPHYASMERRSKGYRVNVQHRQMTNDEANIKRAIIENIVRPRSSSE